MTDRVKHFETMIFNYETTNRTDFRGSEIKPIITTKYKAKGTCLRPRVPPLKDIHALTEWRVPNVPFNLFGQRKGILRTNPHVVQKPYGNVEDYERKTVQLTRPRLVITPATALDDVEDSSRKILIDNMYLTSKLYSMREADTLASAINENSKAPFPGTSACSNPLKIPKLQLQYVSPEWRMDSVSWDNKQLRAFCDPTENFWLKTNSNPTVKHATTRNIEK